ncbi:MAG TPA: pyridoxamine 5'-phosphate oxidase family protein [Candidatus Binatia bacterium]|nr:pyridoxamine 5'-phosphate oxidase family protein [Candidatus Binatia bacterium]
MSVPVTLEALREQVRRFGTTTYLLTVADDGRPHSVAVSVAWDGDDLIMKCGRRTLSNVAARPLVSLLWPPVETGGYSLIVDGDAAVRDQGGEARAVVRPTRAVMHRPSPSTPRPDAECADDCVRLR